jgi:L-ribulose-5-phosphate 3-epimerase
MERRQFLAGAVGAALVASESLTRPLSGSALARSPVSEPLPPLKPMALGLMIQPANGPETVIARVKEIGFSNCFLSLDGFLGKYSPALAQQIGDLLEKYQVTATSAEVVHPLPLVWDFLDGPSTIGLVPRATRAARIDALKQTSDFAKLLRIPHLQTHCGFIPENPRDPLYEETVLAIREVAKYCAANGQEFLMETGQETPTTMFRAIKDVDQPNLGVGLDTANLILYGKANPVDAVGIIGPYVRSLHAKDGKWPTDPMKLGEEVLIGSGDVDFAQVFARLRKLGYTGAVTIERETSGPQQVEDVKAEKRYLEGILSKVQQGVKMNSSRKRAVTVYG